MQGVPAHDRRGYIRLSRMWGVVVAGQQPEIAYECSCWGRKRLVVQNVEIVRIGGQPEVTYECSYRGDETFGCSNVGGGCHRSAT